MRGELAWILCGLALVGAGCVSPVEPAAAASALIEPVAEPVAVAQEPEPANDAPERAPQKFVLEGDAGQFAHARAGGFHGGMSGAVLFELPRGEPSFGLVTATWTSANALDRFVEVWVYGENDVLVAHGFGESPLELPIDGVAFGPTTKLYAMPEPSDPGAMVLSNVHMKLALTYD